MPYVAVEKIGGYNEGDFVPDKIAVVWKDMYDKSPVKLVSGKTAASEKPGDEAEETPPKGKTSNKGKKGKSSKSPSCRGDYPTRLFNINGIGPKTVKDILALYPTEQDLKQGIKDDVLPFRDDQSRLLKKHFGG